MKCPEQGPRQGKDVTRINGVIRAREGEELNARNGSDAADDMGEAQRVAESKADYRYENDI